MGIPCICGGGKYIQQPASEQQTQAAQNGVGSNKTKVDAAPNGQDMHKGRSDRGTFRGRRASKRTGILKTAYKGICNISKKLLPAKRSAKTDLDIQVTAEARKLEGVSAPHPYHLDTSLTRSDSLSSIHHSSVFDCLNCSGDHSFDDSETNVFPETLESTSNAETCTLLEQDSVDTSVADKPKFSGSSDFDNQNTDETHEEDSVVTKSTDGAKETKPTENAPAETRSQNTPTNQVSMSEFKRLFGIYENPAENPNRNNSDLYVK